MEQCVTVSLLLMQILTFLAVCGVIIFEDISEVKRPIDEQKARFNWKKDWWFWRWDDIGRRLSKAFLGAILAKEIGHRMIESFMDLGDVAQTSLELTAIAVSAYFLPKIWK